MKSTVAIDIYLSAFLWKTVI